MTKPIEIWALRTEALRLSRKHIRAVPRQKGIRESSFKASEITAMAKRWLELNHAELIGQALGNLKQEREKSMATVQISSPKVEAL